MKASLTLAILMIASAPVQAACPQELAVYNGTDGSGSLEFRSIGGGMLPEIRLLYPGLSPVTAYLSQDERLERAEIMIPLNCPEGDVTGDELAACLVYRGAVYSIGKDGTVEGLPEIGETAAARVFLPNLAAALWDNPQFGGKGPETRPAELFELSGCQE